MDKELEAFKRRCISRRFNKQDREEFRRIDRNLIISIILGSAWMAVMEWLWSLKPGLY